MGKDFEFQVPTAWGWVDAVGVVDLGARLGIAGGFDSGALFRGDSIGDWGIGGTDGR